MARPTLEQRILKALDRGDMETVNTLKEELKARKELEKMAKKKKAAAPKKVAPAPKSTNSPAKTETKPAKPKKTTVSSDFGIERQEVKGGKNYGKSTPFAPKKEAPVFFDDKSAKTDSKIDKKLWKGVAKTERRPPAEKIEVECTRCEKPFMEYAHNLHTVDGELATVICKKCTGKVKR